MTEALLIHHPLAFSGTTHSIRFTSSCPTPRADITPAMLPVKGNSPQVSRAHTQPHHPHAMSCADCHGIGMKCGRCVRAPHFRYQIEQIDVAYPRLLKDLHFHLANDFVPVPEMHVPVGKSCLALPEPFEIVDTVRPAPSKNPSRAKLQIKESRPNRTQTSP